MPKNFYLFIYLKKFYLSVSTILEIKTKKNLEHKNTQTHGHQNDDIVESHLKIPIL